VSKAIFNQCWVWYGGQLPRLKVVFSQPARRESDWEKTPEYDFRGGSFSFEKSHTPPSGVQHF
jgi:hypothetical protein